MRFIETYLQSHQYKHFPIYSRFLLDNVLEPFVKYQLKISREVDLPVLNRLTHLSEEQLIDHVKISMTEFLGYLSKNMSKELLEISLDKWKADQLKIIGQSELVAEDLLLINYIRGRAFRNFIPLFTVDTFVALDLINEIDSFITGSNTAATNTYIYLLKKEIEKQEIKLLEAQTISGIGSVEWDLLTDKTINSPQVNRIFEMEHGGFDAFINYVYPADRNRVKKAMADALIKGTYECEYRFQKTDKIKYIWAKGIIIFEGTVAVRFIGTVQDITERKKAEQELLDKTIALERSNESLQQFAFIASHDLQEPMRQISTFTDLVLAKEKNLTELSRKSLIKVIETAIRMRQMTDDILAYSTLTKWEGRELCDLNGILNITLDNLDEIIKEKQAKVEYGNLPELLAVPSQIQQLFQNLISNAIKFSRPGVPPRICITYCWLNKEQATQQEMWLADKYLRLSVQDNGIGFDQQFSNKIFGLFSRLNNKKDYEGSGIGLAIAKRITDNHGGMITATSVPGEGACFSITIPQ